MWIISPAGKHLGTNQAPELAANFAWGDDDGRTLHLAVRTSLYRVRLKSGGGADRILLGRPSPAAAERGQAEQFGLQWHTVKDLAKHVARLFPHLRLG